MVSSMGWFTLSSSMWHRGSRSARDGLGFSVSWFFPVVEVSWSPERVVVDVLQLSPWHVFELAQPSQCGLASPAVGATRVRFTLLALNSAITGPFLSSPFLSRVGVSLSMSGSLHLGSPLLSRGTAQSGWMLIVCGNVRLSDMVGISLLAMDLVNLASPSFFQELGASEQFRVDAQRVSLGRPTSAEEIRAPEQFSCTIWTRSLRIVAACLGPRTLRRICLLLVSGPLQGKSSEQGHTALERSGVEDQGPRFGGS